jgi:hypothetical protein
MVINITAKAKPYVISCSVLKNELKALLKAGELDVDISFYSMDLHSDYDLLEKALRKKIEKNQSQSKRPILVVTGAYCLGPEDTAKKLIEEYGVVKVEALNCIDCLFGGHAQFTVADPEGTRIFLSPGWISYFYDKLKKAAGSEHEEAFRNLFSGLKGIVLLDTLGNLGDYAKEIEELSKFTRMSVLEMRKIGLGGLRDVILEALKKSR